MNKSVYWIESLSVNLNGVFGYVIMVSFFSRKNLVLGDRWSIRWCLLCLLSAQCLCQWHHPFWELHQCCAGRSPGDSLWPESAPGCFPEAHPPLTGQVDWRSYSVSTFYVALSALYSCILSQLREDNESFNNCIIILFLPAIAERACCLRVWTFT